MAGKYDPSSELATLKLSRMSKEPIEADEFQKNVIRTLECPVCFETAVPPILLCKTGHFVCGVCRKKVDKCVICREAYTNTRAYAIESIISEIKVKCRHKFCQEVLSVSKLEEHLKICDYRPVLCNSDRGTKCTKIPIEFDQFVEHLAKAHNSNRHSAISKVTITGSTEKVITELQEDDRRWRPKIYHHDGVNFMLHMKLHKQDVCLWVKAMLNKADAKNYIAELHIGQRVDGKIDSESRNIKWTIGVFPVHNTFQEIKRSGDCVAFPALRLISISTTTPGQEGRLFFVDLKIRKVAHS